MSSDFPHDLARLYSPRYVSEVLAAHGLRLKKSLGQNFLVDANIVHKIVAAAAVTADDVVLEIGPGIGHLTAALVARAKHVIAVEIDERLIPILRALFADARNLTILHADITASPLSALSAAAGLPLTKVVANIPYYITTPIISECAASRGVIRSATLTVQSDALVRFTAAPGDKRYSILAVLMRYWGRLRTCGAVPASCFFPRPEVDSTIVQIEPFPQPPVHLSDEALFTRLIRTAFQQRRKMLRNSLEPFAADGYALAEALRAADIADSVRPEQLALEDYARLANALAAVAPARAEMVQ